MYEDPFYQGIPTGFHPDKTETIWSAILSAEVSAWARRETARRKGRHYFESIPSLFPNTQKPYIAQTRIRFI
jgi:hypothetical protein